MGRPALQHTLPERTPPEGTGAQAANPEPDLSPSPPSSRSDDDTSTSSTSSATSDPEHGGPAVAHPATETTEAANAPRTVAATEPHNHPTQPMIHGRRLREALARLDPLPATAFLSEPCIMFRTPPPFLRGPLRRALHFALGQINSASTDDMRERAWKLWLFLPRLLLHRPAGTQRVPKPELLNRFTQFFTGNSSANQRQARRTNQHPTNPNEDARAQRAIHLTRLGELSRARQALLAEPLAPGDEATHQRLTDPTARPQQAYQAIDTDLLQWNPATPAAIPAQLFLTNLARAKKGAAPGPSGLTAEIAKLLLDDAAASHSFQQVCHRLATADIPATIAAAIGLGRMVAIRKASGGVRGLVVGDFLRRLVARSLAQHYATDFEAACHPHQYALSTRAGTEALFHTLQLTTETDHLQTVLSVDGIGAYDHVSRTAMLRGLANSANTPHAQAALPFARLFYSQPSTYLWTDDSDDHGQTHPITQAEGGEQGDPLMPALFSLALDFALRAFQADLLPGERVMAFLDDIYITAPPPRIRIRPDLTGTYATAHDAAVLACLAQLLDHQHGALPEHASHRAHLALDQGGLGLRSAHHHTAAAYWASWHDVAPIIQRKSPNLFTHITEQLTTPVDSATPSIQCLQHVQEFLRNLGLEAPAWAECAPPGPPTQAELPQQLRRWQQAASKVIDQAYANFVEASADPAGQALLESQRAGAIAHMTSLGTTEPLAPIPVPFARDRERFAILARSTTRCGHDPGVPSHSFLPGSPIQQCYNLTAEGAGCKTVTLTDDGYSIESDTPKSTGGSGTAPQPVQLLLAALVGCEQATAKFVAMKMRVPPIRRIQFELHAERDEWGSLAGPIDQHPLQPSRLQRIWGTAHVYSDANASQIRAISEAVKKRCPVASMVIESGCELDVRWVKADE
ncbi:132 kDa protein [Durusdinium trenchii]|uniref:132 kDa protein n=1 Tax=Durusdinium trenchii TaxID=1381693 RepID=A0ABP0Q1J1_9DINO